MSFARVPAQVLALLAAILLACGQDAPGSAEGDAAGSATEGAVANGAPEIVSLRLYPDHPTVRDVLSLEAEVHDPERDSIELDVTWIRSDQVVKTGTDRSFPLAAMVRGDEIWVQVVATDGHNRVSARSPSVRIENLPPQVVQLELAPERPTSNESILAIANARDPEGDDFELSYTWLRNGRAIPDVEGPKLDPGHVRRGDRVAVSVVASDRDTASEPIRSVDHQIVNAPPEILSDPPYELSGDMRYEYRVAAKDPDGDYPLRYSLVQAPDGMEIGLADGVIRWKIPSGAQGSYAVEVAVSDPHGGEVRQRYELGVSWDEAPASSR